MSKSKDQAQTQQAPTTTKSKKTNRPKRTALDLLIHKAIRSLDKTKPRDLEEAVRVIPRFIVAQSSDQTIVAAATRLQGLNVEQAQRLVTDHLIQTLAAKAGLDLDSGSDTE